MRTSIIAAGVAAVTALAIAAPTAASAATSPSVCVQSADGVASIAAGSPTEMRAFSAHGTSEDYACHTSDPTIHSAHEEWRENGTFQCTPEVTNLTGTPGTDKFTWDNGRTSLLEFTDYNLGAIDIIEGSFVSGEFAGTKVSFAGTGVGLITDNLSGFIGIAKACGLGQAVTDVPAGYSGVLKF